MGNKSGPGTNCRTGRRAEEDYGKEISMQMNDQLENGEAFILNVWKIDRQLHEGVKKAEGIGGS